MSKLLLAVAVAATISFARCSPKDADVQASIETKLNAKPDMSGAKVQVKDGVVIIAGECRDESCKADCEKTAQEVKGVKSVINNLTITRK